MKKTFLTLLSTAMLLTAANAASAAPNLPKRIRMSKQELMDKIKGGWAGQTIGVTYGGPTEFVYRGTIIDPDKNIPWGDADYIANTMRNSSWLYDDIYMDLTFVQMIERLGIDVPADSVAIAFATAPYPLWHANQAARYNIMHGIMPPASGHWKNNPHADDIDYQIEADYAGLMCPAMPMSACEISDRIGHIMNYGDGWYGGVYMAAMYSMAFVTSDVETIVSEALKCIPQGSKYHDCMADIIRFHREHPEDWTKAWERCAQRWNFDKGCSEGTLDPLNIDAVVNSAYVIIGLLYGEGDFGRTIDISTRCGQDSDCNPASAAGILGTALGYSGIPAQWLDPLKKAEDIKFACTDISLNDTYRMSYSHALQMIERGGGRITKDDVTIIVQRPQPVPYEESFNTITPSGRLEINKDLTDTYEFEGQGVGMVMRGYVQCPDKSYIARVEVTIDGKAMPVSEMPVSFHDRKLDLFWNYDLAPGNHTVTLRLLNPRQDASVRMQNVVLYEPALSKRVIADPEPIFTSGVPSSGLAGKTLRNKR